MTEMPEVTEEAIQTLPEVEVKAVEDKGGVNGVRASSLRTRPSARPKRTVHFKEEPEEAEPQAKESSVRNDAGKWQKVPPACLGIFLAIALASYVVYISTPNVPSKPRLWTNAELARYNGTDNRPPLLLSILGSVFDVSKGWNHYGPGGGYHHFVGRDASRAFVSGNFSGDGLTDSLQGLSPTEIKAIDDWRLFFVSRYIYLGKLIGTFYDEEGNPTKDLKRVTKRRTQAEKLVKQQKKDEEQFPNCNSRWSEANGGEVWCKTGFYPRIVEKVAAVPRKGPPGTRCACFEEDELNRSGLQEYEGCDPLSSTCKIK